MLKRTFDILVSLLALLACAPLFLFLTVAIKLTSPGPVFYRGVRSGRYGKPFRVLKFRTMVVNAENLGGGTSGLRDPRVTAIGSVLRQYKLDELPQFFNVLWGQMSLVGPRPELPLYTDRFVGEERLILTVRPGITDYSSIRFASLDKAVGEVDVDKVFEEKILPQKNQLRVKYVKDQSFFTDLKILAQTAAKLFTKITER